MKLLAQSNSKANSKKKKRLDKYIVRDIVVSVSPDHNLIPSAGEKTQAGRARCALREAIVRLPLLTQLVYKIV